MEKINFDFKGRTALVTGGAQGFGFDIASIVMQFHCLYSLYSSTDPGKLNVDLVVRAHHRADARRDRALEGRVVHLEARGLVDGGVVLASS